MKQIVISLLLIFNFVGCTMSPKPLDGKARSKPVNLSLICAKQIDIQQISINGAKPPKDAFAFSMKKLKKYTTNNIVIHKTINLTIKEEEINLFIHRLGDKKEIKYLNQEAYLKLQKALDKLPTNGTSFVMIYTPKLSSDAYSKKQNRGLAFYNSDKYKVVAYNQTTINNAPVITDNQSWKIVLTHELGHQLGVPSSSSHNKEGHCTSRECIMYSKPDWQSVVSVMLLNGMPYDFCKKCKAELKNAKEMVMVGNRP